MTDLEIVDPLAWVQSQRGRFFRGHATPIELISHILCDILYLGLEAHVSHTDDWWVVHSPANWLLVDGLSAVDLFHQIVPAPHLGDNEMRSEILVWAFATDICILESGRWVALRGGTPNLSCPPGQALAFTFPAT